MSDASSSERLVVVHSLQRRPELNGKQARLLAFDGRAGRFAVRLIDGGCGLQVLPANLRWWVDGSGSGGGGGGATDVRESAVPDSQLCLTAPVSVGRVNGHDEMRLEAAWSFEAGDIILQESPTIENELSGREADYPLGDALEAFLALPRKEQEALLALQANEKVSTLAVGARKGSSDADAIVRQLQSEGLTVPKGEEARASRFLRVIDANTFQFGPSKAALFVLLSRINVRVKRGLDRN